MSLTHDEQMFVDNILFAIAMACIIGYILLMIMVLMGQAKIMGMI